MLFEEEAGVIGANRHAHFLILLCGARQERLRPFVDGR